MSWNLGLGDDWRLEAGSTLVVTSSGRVDSTGTVARVAWSNFAGTVVRSGTQGLQVSWSIAGRVVGSEAWHVGVLGGSGVGGVTPGCWTIVLQRSGASRCWSCRRGDHTWTENRGWRLATGFQVSLERCRPSPADDSTLVADQSGMLIASLSLLLLHSDLVFARLPQP